MGFLDDDDVPPFIKSGMGDPKWKRRDNLEEWNNYGHKKNSEDFSDSPFADRRPEEEK